MGTSSGDFYSQTHAAVHGRRQLGPVEVKSHADPDLNAAGGDPLVVTAVGSALGLAWDNPTGVTAGAPGVFTGGTDLPFSLQELVWLGALGETVAWLTGESVVLGDGSSAYWDGSGWVAGVAP